MEQPSSQDAGEAHAAAAGAGVGRGVGVGAAPQGLSSQSVPPSAPNHPNELSRKISSLELDREAGMGRKGLQFSFTEGEMLQTHFFLEFFVLKIRQ